MKTVLLGREHEVSAFASSDSTRIAIKCVRYNAEKQCVEATNGRQLIRVPVVADSEEFPPVSGANGEEVGSVSIPCAALSKAMKNAPNGGSLPILRHVALTNAGKDKIRLTTNDLESEQSAVLKPIEFNFPKLESVIPVEPAKFSIALSALELQTIVNYCAKFGGGDAKSVLLEFDDALKPMRWSCTLESGNKASGVLKPCRMA